MADIDLTTAGRIEVVESFEQITLTAGAAITAGDAVRLNTTTGKAEGSNGTTAGEARIIGIAAKSAAAGFGVTVIKRGLLDGFDFTDQDYDEAIYLSDTDATLADAAGTVSVVVGRVVPGQQTTLGTAYDKILSVEL